MDLVPVVLEFVVFVSINTLTLKIIWSMYLLNFNLHCTIQELKVGILYSDCSNTLNKHTMGTVNDEAAIDLPGTGLVHMSY